MPPNSLELPPAEPEAANTGDLPIIPGTGGAVDLGAVYSGPTLEVVTPLETLNSGTSTVDTVDEPGAGETLVDETSKERFWRRAGVVAGISMIATGAAAALNLIPENSIGDLPDAVRIGGSIAYGLAGVNTLHTHAKGSFKSAAERVSNRLRRTLKPDATEEQA